ncbi:MAG: MATE family efflux transporter [Oscillospiraceae bacterium]|jgi:putative MATE family efflux protein
MASLSENKMGVMPVNKLLLNMSVPIIISMLVQALYNIVDSIFVSHYSLQALSAVSLAFPVQNLMISIAVGTGVGINSLLSKSLGERKFDQANKAAVNGIFLALLSFLVFFVLGLTCTRLYFSKQTDDLEIIEYGVQYLSICTVASFGIFGQITFERLLQATGRTFLTMITQGIGAIINIILDPILISGINGHLRFGVAGAAIATVIGQIVAMMIACVFNFKKNKEITIRFRGFRPCKQTIARIYAVGLPSIIMTSITSVLTFALNRILIGMTMVAVNVLGIYFKLQSFVCMPIFGLNNGMVPIIAYNYGARQPNRLIKTVKLSAIYATGYMLLGLLVFQVFPDKLLSLFNADQDLYAVGVIALRLISISFLFAGFNIVSCSVFQALGHGLASLIVSMIRQLVVLLPVAYLLSLSGNVDHVWLAFPFAEIFAVAICVFFMFRMFRTVIKPLYTSEAAEKQPKVVNETV